MPGELMDIFGRSGSIIWFQRSIGNVAETVTVENYFGCSVNNPGLMLLE